MFAHLNYQNDKVPRNITYEMIYNLLIDLFESDRDKAMNFYLSRKEAFGWLSPYEMVKNGRGAELLKLIRKAL